MVEFTAECDQYANWNEKKKFRVLFFQINALLTGFKYNMQICVCSGFIAPDWEEKKTGVINITILLKFFS